MESQPNEDPADPGLPEISVVIIVKDEPAIVQTLAALQPMCEAEAAECIVVDASDGRLADIAASNPWVRWLDFEPPFGRRITIAHQRNVGVRASKAPLVAFCDAGGIPGSTWLHDLKAGLHRFPNAILCGPITSLDQSLTTTVNDLEDGAPVFIAVTANMGFSTASFERIGGFDERYDYGSDADFGWRAEDNGVPVRCLPRATMGMQWGGTQRSLRRARLYGLANARTFLYHPGRIVPYARLYKDTLAYPVWIVGFIATLVLTPWCWWLPLAWLGALALPAAHNLRHDQLGTFLVMKLYRGCAFLVGFPKVWLERKPRVLMVPANTENPYLPRLVQALAETGVSADQFRGWPWPGGSVVAWILLPLRLALRRLQGLRIIHLHWTYTMHPEWFPRRIWGIRSIPRHWFGATIRFTQLIGLRWVYSVHNLLPHQPVFDDDRAARRLLLKRADGLVLLSEESRNRVAAEFNVSVAHGVVIPEGQAESPVEVGRGESREILGLNPDVPAVVVFGHLAPYKRIEEILEALAAVPADLPFALRMGGEPADAGYRATILEGVARLRSMGRDAQVVDRLISDAELSQLLAAGDVAPFAMHDFVNSTSIRLAAASGLHLVLPNVPATEGLTGTIRYDVDASDALPKALTEALRLGVRGAARPEMRWAQEITWLQAAKLHRGVYEQALTHPRGAQRRGGPHGS